MQKVIKRVFSAPSIRLKTLVIIEIVLLLLVSLGVLFYFTRKALIEEEKKDAVERLEGTVQHVDNVLLSVEQTAGNFYYEIMEHLDRPDRIPHYCRRLVECNPNIMGCAIGFKPGYYPDRELFLTYIQRKKYNSPQLIMMDKPTDTPYTKQNWYTETMKTCRPAWIDPGQNHYYKNDPIVTFCIPLLEKSGECIGVIAVGLSIDLLSQIVLANKPTPNSYSLMLGAKGDYIIHPSHEKLTGKTVFDDPEIANDPTALSEVKTILKGGVGEKSFRMNDETWYMFYRPFTRNTIEGRSMEPLEWTIASVYPKEDIFGEYNHLVFHVLILVFVGLLVFYILSRKAIRGQLKPLNMLTESAERIAEGHYDEPIPDTKRSDEIGVFQKHFQVMQRALAADISRQEEQQATLNEHRERLQKIHQQIQEDDQVKAIFLHNVTNRMIAPSGAILASVTTLCNNCQNITPAEVKKEIENIKEKSENILELLSHKFNIPATEMRKEDQK